MGDSQGYVTIRSRATDGNSIRSSDDSTYGSSVGDDKTPAATHDTSRVNYHIRHISDFAKSLEDSAARAFPNRGRSQRYSKVQALLLHWRCDDLFVLPELVDLEQCLRQDYSFETDTFAIPSENAHLELMMRVGQMIKEHESSDTLFVIYYGGHARIDESRQSTWCANRETDAPWLQWSAIQTLLERSLSDVLILLDCCAGAASATFPNGSSITETISASSWDAIAPEPGRFSFTSALIEVLQQWKLRTYSAAMLHAELLARLKHPRPERHNGRNFEARSTPVHFMMTSNHKAPSIEMASMYSEERDSTSQSAEPGNDPRIATGRSGPAQDAIGSEPNEDKPHVMISLALEENQNLDVHAWEDWLAAFPAIAKYVKVQGVFKSHSTLLLLSLPVMVWDLLPDDLACNFIAFVRSNNLIVGDKGEQSPRGLSVSSGAVPPLPSTNSGGQDRYSTSSGNIRPMMPDSRPSFPADMFPSSFFPPVSQSSDVSLGTIGRSYTVPSAEIESGNISGHNIFNGPMLNQFRNSRQSLPKPSEHVHSRPDLAPHVQTRLETYFQETPTPTVAITEFLASNLGVEKTDIDLWFWHRREQQQVDNRFRNLRLDDRRHELSKEGARMILPGHLNNLFEIIPLDHILLVDLRSPSDYDRSHIHGAINLRAPASFIHRASLEVVEKTLSDAKSRVIFSERLTKKCVVFYDRHVEYAWECPSAGAVIHKLRGEKWTGQGFILKGHYREFSASFDKYISGQKITGNAKKYLESRQEKSLQKKRETEQDYDEWLSLLDNEDRVPSTELVPAVKTARKDVTVQHQKDLEDELERRFPDLYRKVLDLKSSDNWHMKAPMVEHLSAGLEKIQQQGGNVEGDVENSGYLDKLQQEIYNTDGRETLDPDEIAHLDSDARSKTDDSSGSVAEPKKGRATGLTVWKKLRSGR